MRQDLSEALDESLTLLGTGQATLEECLARHPGFAAELGPLLEVALEVRRVPLPTSSPAAFAAGKRRMLEALTKKKRRQPASASRSIRRARWLAALFATLLGRQKRLAVPRYALAFRLALIAMVTVVALAVLTVGGLSILYWSRTTVAQAATLDRVSGRVEILPPSGGTWRLVSADERVEAGDRIRTGSLSAARLAFFDGSTTELGADTEVTVVQMSSRRDGGGRITLLHQTSGQTRSRVQRLPDRASRFEIETPTAVTAVRGTEFALAVEADGTTQVVVVEGAVNVVAQETTVVVLAGQETTVQPDQSPAPARPGLTTPTPTVTSVPTPASTPTAPPTTSTPEPLGQTKVPGAPGLTKTPQPPGQTRKPPQSPGLTKTPQPPGQTRKPQPPGLTKTPQPPGHTKKPKPTGKR